MKFLTASLVLSLLIVPEKTKMDEPPVERIKKQCDLDFNLYSIEPVGYQDFIAIVNYVDRQCSYLVLFGCGYLAVYYHDTGIIDFACKSY